MPRPPTTAELLADAGAVLYGGAEWQGRLSVALGVSVRTMQRWANGEMNPRDPAGLRRELVALARQRGGALLEWADRNEREEG